ncbi:hypothetical protein KQI42_08950 [Tissierella sp. MSJ-40]|uniref:Peptidase U62 n=1 Tax=Tissierella simiarum TaxID=2841534 RepID=A0ABS6E5D6_9FIRM|nr:metallopeptidase TldD-related protein [Tissierella simiarum]MBU5438134.1 hypothetical protein [Tissierella simiarum]
MIKEKYINRVKKISINVTQTKIDSISHKDIEKTGLRIYKNGYIGYSGAIGRYEEEELEKRAKDSLNNKMPYQYNLGKNLRKKEDFSSEIIKEDNLVEELNELLGALRKEQPEFYFSNKFNLIEHEVRLLNDNGLDLYYKDKYIDFILIFKEKTSPNIMDGFVGLNGRKYSRKLALENINQICSAYRNKVMLPNKKVLPVVFSTDDMLPLEKFLEDLNGDRFGSKSSLLSNKRNKKIFNENFTLYQTNNPNDCIVPFFDAEGVINDNHRYPLIKEGIIVSPYTDKRISNKYNLPLTGCAAAEYDGMPNLGFPKLKIKESEKTAKELLGGEMGIFILVASGGDFTPEGNFATPVQLAFLFDGEKFIGRLPELSISSNVFHMFGDSFLGVSKDTMNPLSNNKFLIMNMEVSKI